MPKPTATILVGPSGAGKSTWTANNQSITETRVVSADFWFTAPGGKYSFDPSQLDKAHASCLKMYMRTLIYGKLNVVVDNTNTTIAEIAPYISIAQAYGYKIRIIFFDTPPDVCYERNTKGVPRKTITAMYERAVRMFEEWPRHWPDWEREFYLPEDEQPAARRPSLELVF